MTLDAVLRLLVAAVYEAGGQSQWARLNGVSPALVSAVLRKVREPGPRILAALKLERVVSYRRIRG